MPTHVHSNGKRLSIVVHLIDLTWVHLSAFCILIKRVVERLVICFIPPPLLELDHL